MLVDSHCHLDFPDFAEDLDDIMGRAARAGVGAMLTIGTHLSRAEPVLALAKRFDNVCCTVGIHPHEAGREEAVDADTLIGIAERNPQVVGFGETGLDYYYDHSPREEQRRSFRTHIAAARTAGLPVVVHSRDADEDTIAILRDEQAKGAFGGVIHCFSAGHEVAEAAVEMGMYISLSGIVTFKAAEDLRAVVRDLPRERVLVETDAPYLAPVPRRGKRNEPAYVSYTAEKVGELLGMDAAETARVTTENFFRLFSRFPRPDAAA